MYIEFEQDIWSRLHIPKEYISAVTELLKSTKDMDKVLAYAQVHNFLDICILEDSKEVSNRKPTKENPTIELFVDNSHCIWDNNPYFEDEEGRITCPNCGSKDFVFEKENNNSLYKFFCTYCKKDF